MNNWKEICAKCADGEIEPTFCEYYGEPDGCNSPTRGEHTPVGNAAAVREAVVKCINLITGFGNAEVVKTPLEVIVDIESILNAALAAPARNCDHIDYLGRFKEFCCGRNCQGCKYKEAGADCFAEFLLDRAEEKKGGAV